MGDFTGCGLIGGLELVQDKATKALYPAAVKLGAIVDRHARKNGLILRIVGNRLAFSPPLIITEDEIHEMARLVRVTLDDVLDKLQK